MLTLTRQTNVKIIYDELSNCEAKNYEFYWFQILNNKHIGVDKFRIKVKFITFRGDCRQNPRRIT